MQIVFRFSKKEEKYPCFLQKLNSTIDRSTMFMTVPDFINSHLSIYHNILHIKSVIFLLYLNACLKSCVVIAGPTVQQEQELLLLEALSKRQPSYYGTSNSLMDILGRSMCSLILLMFESKVFSIQLKVFAQFIDFFYILFRGIHSAKLLVDHSDHDCTNQLCVAPVN